MLFVLYSALCAHSALGVYQGGIEAGDRNALGVVNELLVSHLDF